MWGNSLGWKISLLMLVAAVAAGLWLHAQMQITDPTELSLNPQNLAALSPPLPQGAIVDQNQPGDAGQRYSRAAKEFDDDADACEQFSLKPQGTVPGPMQLVLDATHLSSMNLFDEDPGQIIDYQSDHPPLDNLKTLGTQMESAGLLLRRIGKDDESRRFLLGVYALGNNLLRERICYDEYSAGLALVDGSIEALSEMQPAGSPKQSMLQDQHEAMLRFDQTAVQPIYSVLASADPQQISQNAGDVYRFAAKSQERMFRVEAILKLGRYRFNAARRADQLAAPRFLARFSQDSDPVIRAAAEAAANLSDETYRMIH